MEIDFENGCGIVESLKINKVNERDWKKVLEGYKKWELKEMGENSEWVEEEMDKEGLSGVTEKDEIEDVTRQYEWDSNWSKFWEVIVW